MYPVRSSVNPNFAGKGKERNFYLEAKWTVGTLTKSLLVDLGLLAVEPASGKSSDTTELFFKTLGHLSM